ncbi:MAG: tRNA (adenosine(37)-N6)-dimethylallyltransferase MiaA [Dehalococcoidia bacterium]|nr:tRNA (adenosine(37)-N6)-dimethylallyltransferase MiaA [Dehalococcoidia bacterium]
MPDAPRHLVALVGPTASGKTAVALALARRLPLEVISADSRQVRAAMRIGTAAPSAEELAAVPHHLVAIVAPDAPWSLADWLAAARAAIAEVWARGRLPLVVGGTGQYVWALLEGWDVPAVEADWGARATLEGYAAEHGAPALHARLAARDPASAARIDPANVRRVVRAIEIVEATGAPVPPLAPRDPGFTSAVVGLRWPRAESHRRADARVAAMFAGGLIEETRALVAARGRGYPALDSIGYSEALAVIDGTLTVEQAIARTRTETHRLIRMQANWFRTDDPRIAWVDGADMEAAVAALEAAARPPLP